MDWCILHVVGRDEANEFADGHQRLFVVVTDEVAHTAHAVVGHGTTEGFLVHILISHSFHHVRTCDKHLALFLHHENKVCECRRVAGTASTRTENGANLWDDTRRHHVALKDVGESSERFHTFLNTCTTRVIEADDWCTILERKILHLGYLLCIGCRQ